MLPGGERVKRRLSIGQYRAIDLAFFAALTVFFEFVLTRMGLAMPYAPFLVSVTPVICAIVMMRWGWPAAIHAVLGGAAYCLASDQGGEWFLVRCAGNLVCLEALLLLRVYPGAARVRDSAALSMVYGAAVHLLMQLGRSVITLALHDWQTLVVKMAGMEAVTLLFTVVLMWIVRRLDGLFEDQRHYLDRVRREEEEGGF